MATFVFSKNEATCQEESEFTFTSFGSISDKKENNNDRAAFYKKPIKRDNYKLELDYNDTPQEIRRQRILYYQKKNRDEAINARRGLVEEVFNSNNEEEMEAQDESYDMEVDPVRRKKKFHRMNKRYANLLMLSEWMLEVPQDFADKWIMVPCPVGTRCSVVAYQGSTKAFNKNGRFIKKFRSALPGGNGRRGKNTCTILDCIWNEEKGIFYVLDVLAWSKQEMLECETECRFFWIKAQIEELDDIQETKKGYNDYPFKLLPNIPCDRDFHDSLESIIPSINLDGLLFYHKEVHYTSGKTPLVVWLKPYMLPEVLGMNVPAPYDEKPSDYIDFEHHLLKVFQEEKERQEKKQQKINQEEKEKQEKKQQQKINRRSKTEQEDME